MAWRHSVVQSHNIPTLYGKTCITLSDAHFSPGGKYAPCLTLALWEFIAVSEPQVRTWGFSFTWAAVGEDVTFTVRMPRDKEARTPKSLSSSWPVADNESPPDSGVDLLKERLAPGKKGLQQTDSYWKELCSGLKSSPQWGRKEQYFWAPDIQCQWTEMLLQLPFLFKRIRSYPWSQIISSYPWKKEFSWELFQRFYLWNELYKMFNTSCKWNSIQTADPQFACSLYWISCFPRSSPVLIETSNFLLSLISIS